MQVKINCESDRVESADSVASLFTRGALLETPRAVPNEHAQNGITFVLELEYPYGGYMAIIDDADNYCRARAQDCIAVLFDDGIGTLYGLNTDDWLPFNREYFID